VTSRIAVLASGAGSNLQALLRFLQRPERSSGDGTAVALVVSNRATAGALTIAVQAGVTTSVLTDPNDGPALATLLREHQIDVVALAGYLRRIPRDVTSAWRGRMINVHPALLPAFGGFGMFGMRVHRSVLDAGVGVTGVTVHFVDEIYDHGPIIAQWPVPVLAEDTPAALAERVLRIEHRLYPCAVEAVASGRISLDAGGHVRGRLVLPTTATTFALRNEETLPCME
jgi:phosphoribosylglycinamide formyltransferase 1